MNAPQSNSKLPRPDALLKNLPPKRQAAIWEFKTTPRANGKCPTLAETAKWLADDGVKVSGETVSQFLVWYSLRSQSREDEVTTDAIKQNLKDEVQNITEEELDAFGQKTFSLLAIRRQDPETFVMVRTARTKGQVEKAKLKLREQAEARAVKKLEFDREKFKEGLRTKLEAGLAELAQYIKANPAAQSAYEAFKKEVKIATK